MNIRINHPGDGHWIMQQVQGVFSPDTDHSLMNYDGSNTRRGGFALCNYLGASITVHMAGSDPRWCSRELMWMVFDYSFNQLGVRKVLALVRSTNEIALDQDMRAGFKLEAIIREVYPDADMWVLGMTRAQCRWLALKPKHHRIERAA